MLFRSANARDVSSIPELGGSPGGGNGNPFQYSCLENSTDRGAWRAIQSMGSQRVGHDGENVLIYLFIFGCAGSSLLCALFSGGDQCGLFSSFYTWASLVAKDGL